MDILNAVGDWILPLNCHWFIFFIIVSVVLAIAAWVWTGIRSSSSKYVRPHESGHVDGVYVTTRYPIRTFLRGSMSVVMSAIALAFIVWIIYASNRPVEVDWEEKLDIKPVVYPNGRVVQMFSCNGTNYNANEMFKSAPPEGSHVRRLVYKRVYCGVYFPDMNKKDSSLNDGFFLVTPDKNERKADSVVPDKQ